MPFFIAFLKNQFSGLVYLILFLLTLPACQTRVGQSVVERKAPNILHFD